MLDIGFYHPLIVHFAISLLMVGVLFRWISFNGRATFTGPAAAALVTLGKVVVPRGEQRLRFRHGWLTANALEALGQIDAARTALQELQIEFPDSERLRRRLEQVRENVQKQSWV